MEVVPKGRLNTKPPAAFSTFPAINNRLLSTVPSGPTECLSEPLEGEHVTAFSKWRTKVPESGFSSAGAVMRACKLVNKTMSACYLPEFAYRFAFKQPSILFHGATSGWSRNALNSLSAHTFASETQEPAVIVALAPQLSRHHVQASSPLEALLPAKTGNRAR
jgi:hypothetical protein